VQTSVRVDGVLAPLARGEGGKTNNVCVDDGVGNTGTTMVGWEIASEEEPPDSRFLTGKGTNEESLDDRRRDLEDAADEVMPEDAEEMDERWETCCSAASGSICTVGNGMTGATSFSGGGLRLSFLSGGFWRLGKALGVVLDLGWV